MDDTIREFLKHQRDIEIGFSRFSESFGPELLPGMVAQPCFAVPKPGSSKFRLVNDHTAGHSSLNTAIPPEDGSFRPDNLWDLGSLLLAFFRANGRTPAWLFKSDASSAYRLLPCHPRWQVRQATMIDGNFHIDCCCVFGNHTSGAIWTAFYALVLWAGVYVKGLPGLLHYVDDAFSFEPDEALAFYAPYDGWYPKKQVGLLNLFDEVGIPHEKRKQEFGCELTIIGLQVSLDSMTITMPFEKHTDLVQEIT